MRIHPAEQGTDEWLEARRSVITGSRTKALMTAGGKQAKGKGANTLVVEIVGEILIGRPLDEVSSQWMDRGSMLEEEASQWLQFVLGMDIPIPGLCIIDDEADPLCERVGASPDGYVPGLVAEYKSPAAKTQIRYLLNSKELEAAYAHQTQTELLVTEADECHLVSYCPGLPPVHLTIWPDAEYQAELRKALEWAVETIDDAVARIRAMPEHGEMDEQTAADMAVFGN